MSDSTLQIKVTLFNNLLEFSKFFNDGKKYMKEREETQKPIKHVPNNQKHVFLDLADLEATQSKLWLTYVLGSESIDRKQVRTPNTKNNISNFTNQNNLLYR